MLILILINVQCLQNVVFSFEKRSYSQNLSLGCHHPLPPNAVINIRNNTASNVISLHSRRAL